MKVKTPSLLWMTAWLVLALTCCVMPLFAQNALETAQARAEALFQGARWAPQAQPPVPSAQGKPAYEARLLKTLLEEVWDEAAAGSDPILLFDLDDTLFDPRPRHARILSEFASDPDMVKRHGAELAKLAPIEDSRMSYAIFDTLKGYGVTDAAVLKDYEAFWLTRFFDNAYFETDAAIPGGPEFVKAARDAGATIVYITGRWEELRPGSVAALAKRGFPFADGKSVHLFMKPDSKMKDDAYKDDKLKEIAKMGTVVGGFENEPKNINIFKKHFPNGRMFFLDTRHSGRKDPAGKVIAPDAGIHWVKDYTP